ncbi:MAG: hypothetical protein GY904_01480 [Planctomycetaceae bacterium]|nr:hypothetical protein [Planctomycetaceae bacterium]
MTTLSIVVDEWLHAAGRSPHQIKGRRLGRRSDKKSDKKTDTTRKYLISPTVDAVCGGSLSLVIAILVIAYSSAVPGGLSSDLLKTGILFPLLYLLTDFLINIPHFMASYRVLYSRPSSFRKHPGVTIAGPIIGIAFLVYVGCWTPPGNTPASLAPDLVETGVVETGVVETGVVETDGSVATAAVTQPTSMLFLSLYVAPIVLGWHYVGQSWGTTACFAFLSGFRMSVTQRRLIRSGFYALFAYHVVWAFSSMQLLQTWYPEQQAGEYMNVAVMSTCRVVVLACFALGIFGFFQMARDHQKRVPALVWLPWLATFSWYVMVDISPASFFLLQIFHALQYLMFPARVEINHYVEREQGEDKQGEDKQGEDKQGEDKQGEDKQGERGHLRFHMIAYYLALVVVGLFAFEWTQVLEWTLVKNPPSNLVILGTATMVVINLHHYFIDAVIWKIRDPEVRHSIFGHLES